MSNFPVSQISIRYHKNVINQQQFNPLGLFCPPFLAHRVARLLIKYLFSNNPRLRGREVYQSLTKVNISFKRIIMAMAAVYDFCLSHISGSIPNGNSLSTLPSLHQERSAFSSMLPQYFTPVCYDLPCFLILIFVHTSSSLNKWLAYWEEGSLKT